MDRDEAQRQMNQWFNILLEDAMKRNAPQPIPLPQTMAVIEDQRSAYDYKAPELSVDQAKEAIAAWPFKDQETLYRWLHGTFRCRM